MVHRPNETIKEKMKGNRMEPKYWSSTSREHFSFFFVEKVKDISLQRSRFIHFSSPFCQLDRTPPPYSEATPAPPLIGGRSGKSVFRPQGCVLGFDKKAQEGGATFFFRGLNQSVAPHMACALKNIPPENRAARIDAVAGSDC